VVEAVPAHAVPAGPLGVRWLAYELEPLQAGALSRATVMLENAGSDSWRDVLLAYHWLDELDNAIDWDGLRTPLPRLEPGTRTDVDAGVRAPMPPGRYRLAFDLVAELRAWFSELGSEPLETAVDVLPRSGRASTELPGNVARAEDWQERVDAAHAEGYAVVAGAVAWEGGVLHPRPRALEPYLPGTGRNPGFTHPLLCPSVIEGVLLTRVEDVAGLPAFAAPAEEPWIYDGRVVVTVTP
jgi:hypothetical protein